MYSSLQMPLHLAQTIRVWLTDVRVIRSSGLRWMLAAWNTPLQLSDVSHEMRQTLQMRGQLRLISHYKCCFLWVSGFSPTAHDCVWPDCVLEGRSSARNTSLKPKETFQTLEAECSISLPANSLSVLSKIFPLMPAERQSLWRLLLGVAKCPEALLAVKNPADNIN